MRKIERHAIAVNSTSGLRSVPNPKKTAKALQRLGTKGDDILAHINAKEATLLDMLADGKLDGGGRNRRTGLKSFGENDSRSDNNGPGGGGRGEPGGSASTSGVGDGTPGTADNSGRGDGGNDGHGFRPDNNPEMGGGLARGRGLASVDALGPAGRDVNAASSVMAGLDPSWSDRALDFTGWNSPGGVPGSRAANVAATMAGGLIGGPLGAAAASVAHNVALGGRSLADTAPAAVGGLVAGGLGSLAGRTLSDAVQGRMSYESPMTENDRARKDAALDAAQAGTTGVPGQPGMPGASDGADAGTAYVMAPPAAAAAPTAAPAAPAPRDVWDEAGFLARNPEVGKAVENGTWTSGRSFNTAYKAQAGANYDSAKALGLISPYRDDMLKSSPGQAVAYRGA